MTPARLLLGVLLAAVMAVAIGSAGTRAAAGGAQVVEIDIHHSHYTPAEVAVPAGVPVRFRIVNTDPIDHEWIVGDDAVHAAHRTGTEASHGSRPTERSIPAGGQIETVITFDEPGRLAFICHLPGHEAYGMVGTLIVTGS